MTTITCNIVDICYSGFLNDHHNNENELLLAVPVYPHMTPNDMICDLTAELSASDHLIFELCENDDLFDEAIAQEFKDRDDLTEVIHNICRENDIDINDTDLELPEEFEFYLYAVITVN